MSTVVKNPTWANVRSIIPSAPDFIAYGSILDEKGRIGDHRERKN